MNRIRTQLGALALVALLVGSALGQAGQVGSPAADWTLDAWGGGTYSLHDYLGQKVVLMFVIGYG